MMVRKFRHVDCKDDADWVKQCMLMEIERTRQEGTFKEDLVGLC